MENKNIQTAFDAVKNLDLSGKVFLVTGGYSGLGAASVEALLKAKGQVIIVGRNKSLPDSIAFSGNGTFVINAIKASPAFSRAK